LSFGTRASRERSSGSGRKLRSLMPIMVAMPPEANGWRSSLPTLMSGGSANRCMLFNTLEQIRDRVRLFVRSGVLGEGSCRGALEAAYRPSRPARRFGGPVRPADPKGGRYTVRVPKSTPGELTVDGIALLAHQALLQIEAMTGSQVPVEELRSAALAARGSRR